MLSAHRLARLLGRCATGGANHIRSSLLVVQEDTVSCAGVGSSGPPEDREAGCRVRPRGSQWHQRGGVTKHDRIHGVKLLTVGPLRSGRRALAMRGVSVSQSVIPHTEGPSRKLMVHTHDTHTAPHSTDHT